ncbi:hypothetical protein AVEN_175308-1 [Araneus ventricosus]|uniref:Uncharacterized protein n=1 Tax=Araneus ventricosus TaxID=182803 RepID=A0A4Y2GG86_ARAVE|nr:hypothetical protein AVEN_175308-1 [Araneus ventricosus]
MSQQNSSSGSASNLKILNNASLKPPTGGSKPANASTSQPAGREFAPVISLDELIVETRAAKLEKNLSQILMQKLKDMNDYFQKRKKEVRMGIRNEIVTNFISPMVNKIHERES